MIHTEGLILALIHLVAAGVFLAEVRDLHADRIVTGRRRPSAAPSLAIHRDGSRDPRMVHAAQPLPPPRMRRRQSRAGPHHANGDFAAVGDQHGTDVAKTSLP